MRRPSLSIVYLLMLLLVGLGYLAILPLFEGFDETAHFSSMRQIADTKTIPELGKSFLDREATEYRGPAAYGSLTPPFDVGMVYPEFFRRQDLVDSYAATYRQPHPHAAFTQGDKPNWQAQHPPLYYLLMAILEKATDGLSFVTQIFLLRVGSYLLALAGVGFGLLAIRYSDKPSYLSTAMVGFILYPIVLPMYFPEFARMGNDSMCLFWVGLLALLLALWWRDEQSRIYPLAMGMVLALGMLTKAFFVPITAALVVFLLLRMWRRKARREWQGIALMLAPALIAGAGWAIYQSMIGGSGAAGEEAVNLAQHGGLIANLKLHFSFFAIVRGILAVFVSWIWTGTWSLTRLRPIFYVPVLALVFWIIGAYLRELKRRPLSDLAWLPTWLFGIFGCGLMYHILIGVALVGNATTPGWYLHILMPWAAPALGIGVVSIWQHARARYLLVGLLAYAVLFQAMALWAQFAMFTGCASKSDAKYYTFSAHEFCLVQAPRLVDRLAILGWPAIAVIGFGGGMICAVWLLIALRKACVQSLAVLEKLEN